MGQRDLFKNYSYLIGLGPEKTLKKLLCKNVNMILQGTRLPNFWA